MQKEQVPQPQAGQIQNNGLRWTNQRDLVKWVKAFQVYFPRKAHLAKNAAAALAGFPTFDEMFNGLSKSAPGDDPADTKDRLYSNRRMTRFKEDRLTLIRNFRILPDAADHFLANCPVGCRDCLFDGIKDHYYDEALCYYRDDQSPSSALEAIVEQQYQTAAGQSLRLVDGTARLGEYLPPQMITDLFNFMRLAFEPDFIGEDGIDPAVPAVRVGWAGDAELGRVECFAMAFTAPPNWCRDEVFFSVLAQVSMTRNLDNRPVLLLNNLPQQLVSGGNTYTSYGWVVSSSKVFPLLVTHRHVSLADLLVELATFNASSSTAIADDKGVALHVFWDLLRQHSPTPLPESPAFSSMPDNWMVIR